LIIGAIPPEFTFSIVAALTILSDKADRGDEGRFRLACAGPLARVHERNADA
jgi:hypothetical protein